MRKTTTLNLSDTDRNLLDAVREKTGAKNNSEAIRNLIRTSYFEVMRTNKTQMNEHIKMSELKPGESIWITGETHTFKKQ